MIIREGYIIPYLKLWKYEIGGGFFENFIYRLRFWKQLTKVIIKHHVRNEWTIHYEEESYSSIGFKCPLFGIYIKRYDK